MRLPALFAIMLVGVIAAFVTASTGAVFTDVATSTANAFTAGTLDLKLADPTIGGGPQDSLSAQYTLPNMAPGDGQVIQTTVSNAGNLALRYALSLVPSTFTISSFTSANPSTVTTSTNHGLTSGASVTISGTGTGLDGTSPTITVTGLNTFTIPNSGNLSGSVGTVSSYGALYSVLKWKIRVGGTCSVGPEPEATATFDTVGAGSFVIGSAGSSNYVALPANGKAFGDKLTGFQAGDRSLGASPANEVLCIKVVMPLTTPGTPGQAALTGYQGATGVLNFEFDAEQTVNNP